MVVTIPKLLCLITVLRTIAAAPERRYACWGSFGPPVVSAQCPRDTVIHVVRSGLRVQGRGGTCVFRHTDCGCDHDEVGCNMPDVHELCSGRSACRLDVTQQYISADGCRGFSDYMFLDFTCISPEARESSAEHTSDVCSSHVSGQKEGSLKSPNYPAPYSPLTSCRCSLSPAGDAHLELSVAELHLEDDSCREDSVLVQYYGRDVRLCGQQGVGRVVASASAPVMVLFTSGPSQSTSGRFWLKYKALTSVDVQCSTFNLDRSTSPKTTTRISSTTSRPARGRRIDADDVSPELDIFQEEATSDYYDDEYEKSYENYIDYYDEEYGNDDHDNFDEFDSLRVDSENQIRLIGHQGDANSYETRDIENTSHIINRGSHQGTLKISPKDREAKSNNGTDSYPWWFAFTAPSEPDISIKNHSTRRNKNRTDDHSATIEATLSADENGVESSTFSAEPTTSPVYIKDRNHTGIRSQPKRLPSNPVNGRSSDQDGTADSGDATGSSDTFTAAVIAGGVVGGLVLLVAIVLVTRFIINRNGSHDRIRQRQKERIIRKIGNHFN